jgi:hypothetical protein
VAAPATEPGSPDLLSADGARYTLRHYLALLLVASVLGALVWSLRTADADTGAIGAPPPVPFTTTPSVR